MAASEGAKATEAAVVAVAEALEAEGQGPRCPLLKSWMLSLTPMSTRSTSEVIGGQEWRPSSSSSGYSCVAVLAACCCDLSTSVMSAAVLIGAGSGLPDLRIGPSICGEYGEGLFLVHHYPMSIGQEISLIKNIH